MTDQPIVSPLPDPQYTMETQVAADVARQSPPGTGQPFVSSPTPAVQGGFVYAVGRLRARFSTLGVEKEFAQLSDAYAQALVQVSQLKTVLSQPENRYLARHMCWVFSGPQVDACTVIPRDDGDVAQMVEALAPDDDGVIQAVVGSPAGGALPAACLATGLPPVWAEQLLSFTMDEFIDALPRPEDDGEGSAERTDDDEYRSVVRQVFERLTQRADNRGMADEHRALNYLALRYPPAYHTTWQALNEGKALVGIDIRPAPSAERRLVAARLVFRSGRTQVVERYHCLVDVTDVFPFLASPLTMTYD